MFIDRSFLNQLNKDIFGGGLIQTKKLRPDYGKLIMPDPRLPKVKRFQFVSNNPLETLSGVMTGSMIAGPQMAQSQLPMQNLAQTQYLPPQAGGSQMGAPMEPPMGPPMEQEIPLDQPGVIEPSVAQVVAPPVESAVPPETAAPPEAEPTPSPPATSGAFSITDLGDNTIKVPVGYGTDDKNEFTIINMMNSPTSEFELAIEENGTSVYKKPVSYIFIFYII